MTDVDDQRIVQEAIDTNDLTPFGAEVRNAGRAALVRLGERARQAGSLELVRRMALYGVGPGTTAEECLATIAAYATKRVADDPVEDPS